MKLLNTSHVALGSSHFPTYKPTTYKPTSPTGVPTFVPSTLVPSQIFSAGTFLKMFSFTGNVQSLTLPNEEWVSQIWVSMWGAGGGGAGGGGAYVEGILNVTPGQTLYVIVGQGGDGESYGGSVPSTVGGGGACITSNNYYYYCTTGGGRTAIQSPFGVDIVTAGGGGGGYSMGGWSCVGGSASVTSTSYASGGTTKSTECFGSDEGGGGGFVGGGSNTTGGCGSIGGSKYLGGSCVNPNICGAGGGGYYGGGSGNQPTYPCGGGGSSYLASLMETGGSEDGKISACAGAYSMYYDPSACGLSGGGNGRVVMKLLKVPTFHPTVEATSYPSIVPSPIQATMTPTFLSTKTTTSRTPTYEPSVMVASNSTSAVPFIESSFTPSYSPSFTQSMQPSVNPSFTPSLTTSAPTPSITPTTTKPHIEPSNIPTNPTISPYKKPSVTPSLISSVAPTLQPTKFVKELFFNSGPLSVYTNVTTYIIKQSPISSYLFVFQLSHLPSTQLVVTPFLIGGNRDLIQIVPSRFLFYSTSNQKQGSFYITGPSIHHGEYSIHLNISGSSVYEYSSLPVTYSVTLLSSSSVFPPPKLTSARLNDGGSGFTIFFDSPTDQGKITMTNWNCSLLFNFKQSSSTLCSWANSSAVVTTFGKNPKFLTSTNITILGGKLKSQCNSDCNLTNDTSTTSVTLLPAYHPIIPKVVIYTSTAVTSCDDIVLDASSSFGSGGRPFASIFWTVLEDDVVSNHIISFMNKFNSVNEPIRVPKSMITGMQYSFTLTLTNFMGQRGQSTAVIFVNQSNTANPSITILGASNIVLNAGDQLILSASATASSCLNQSVSLNYIWSLYPNTMNLFSISKNPSQYLLPVYSLSPGQSYTVRLTVQTKSAKLKSLGQSSTQITVIVIRSSLSAIIKGGTDFHPPVDQPFILDATLSRDYDLPSTVPQNLYFSWTCYISSVFNLGDDCGFSGIPLYSVSSNVTSLAFKSSTPAIRFPNNILPLTNSYVLTCYVFSKDGRMSSSKVTLSASPSGSVVVSVALVPAYVIQTDSFSITGKLSYTSDLVAQWSVSLSDVSYPVSASTQLKRQFSNTDAKAGILYPITILPGSLPGGRTYQFRLTAYPFGSQNIVSYTEVSIKVVRPPQNGYVTSLPSKGYALDTNFKLTAVGWVDDPESLPLSYTFSYFLSQLNTATVVGILSPISFINSNLPAGRINVTGVVYNTFHASAQASVSVDVIVNQTSTVSVSAYLDSALKSAASSGNSNLALQAIGNAAFTVNTIACPPITNCTKLYRNPCHQTPLTCGSCLNDYSGVIGDSNVPCSTNFTRLQIISGTCSKDADCQSHRCVNNICKNSLKFCKSSIYDQICSGNGICGIFDSSSNSRSNADTECTIVDEFCYVQCECNSGYGGSDCSLSQEELQAKSQARSSICEAVSLVGSTQNPSKDLIDTLSVSLNQAYNPSEVITKTGFTSCLNTLSNISKLAKQGYMKPSTSNSFFNTISNFLSAETRLPYVKNLSDSSFYFTGNNLTTRNLNVLNRIDSSIAQFQQGYFQTVTIGQQSLQVLVPNLRISFHYDYVSYLSSTALAAPASISDYSALQSSISLNFSQVTLVCGWNQTAQLSVASILINPFGSQSVLSPAFRFESSVSNNDISRRTTLYPVYFVTLQYHKKQAFNFTAIRLGQKKSIVNYTIPECRTYDKLTGEYISCQHCNISSISDHNVTYACYSNLICSNANVPGSYTDDATLSTTTNDAIAILNNMILELTSEFVEVLSINPLGIDLKAALPVITLTGCLLFILIVGVIGFKMWDLLDHEKIMTELKDRNENCTDSSLADPINSNSTIVGSSTTYTDFKSQAHTNAVVTFQTLATPAAISRIINHPSRITHWSNETKSSKSNKSSKSIMSSRSHLAESEDDFSYENEMTINERDALKYSKIFKTPYKKELRIANVINDFMNEVLPVQIFEEESKWKRFFDALFTQHRYIRVFAEKSLTDTRLLRFLSVCRIILLAVFIDTLFFQICYPDGSKCPTYTTQTSCLAAHSPIASVCQWQISTKQCSPNDPPSNMFFEVMVSLVCILLAVPTDLFFDVIDKEILSKRPDLPLMGLSIDRWLTKIPNFTFPRNSELLQLMVTEPSFNDDRGESFFIADRQNDFFRIETSAESLYDNPIARKYDSFEAATYRRHFATVADEAAYILENVDAYLKQYAHMMTSDEKKKDEIKVIAIMHQLHVGLDGVYEPLNFYQSFIYGNTTNKLIIKLTQATLTAEKIKLRCSQAMGITKYYQDVSLIHSFIEGKFVFIFTTYTLYNFLFKICSYREFIKLETFYI